MRKVKSLGFDGKLCIHPRQVGVVQEVFKTSEKKESAIDFGSSDFEL